MNYILIPRSEIENMPQFALNPTTIDGRVVLEMRSLKMLVGKSNISVVSEEQLKEMQDRNKIITNV